MTQSTPIILTIPQNLGGLRLDQALQQLLPEYSRSRLQTWIKDGLITVSDQNTSAKLKVWGGEKIHIIPQAAPEENAFKAQDIAIDIVHEDDYILVINKPAGLVVHPAAGNWEGTLLNALLHHVPQLQAVPRAGIVHRLDKDTSGLLVVAKSLTAQTNLVRQLQARTVKREYRAIVWGQIWRNGTVNEPVGRHLRSRTRMAVVKNGRAAVTHYEVLERFAVHTYLRCMLETGRTHQIRVHMQHLKAPLVGDPVYGMRGILPLRAMTPLLRETVQGFGRQALHAVRLGLNHPASGEAIEWQAELPADMKQLLEAMRSEAAPEEDFDLSFEQAEYEDEMWDEEEDYIEDDDDVE